MIDLLVVAAVIVLVLALMHATRARPRAPEIDALPASYEEQRAYLWACWAAAREREDWDAADYWRDEYARLVQDHQVRYRRAL